MSARIVAEYGISIPYSGRLYNRQEETPNEYARVSGRERERFSWGG